MRRPQLETHRFRLLLGLQTALLLGYPYLNATRTGASEFCLLLTSVFLVGLYSVDGFRHMSPIGIPLAGAALVGMWWPGNLQSAMRLVGLACESAFCFYVTFKIAADVFRNEEVSEDTLSGAICIYVFLGMGWTAIYGLLEGAAPGSFTFGSTPDPSEALLWDDLLYFSFTSLTTTGYGDITPVSRPARSLAMLEHIVGVLYLAILVARLVAMYRGPAERKRG